MALALASLATGLLSHGTCRREEPRPAELQVVRLEGIYRAVMEL